jgi:hypothetical protein
MSIKEEILNITVNDPQYRESIEVIQQQLSNTNIVAEDLVEAIKMLEYVLQNPEAYAEVRQAAIDDGLIDENMFPPQFDYVLIISLLAVLYTMQDNLAQQGYARGGLRVGGRQLDFGGQGGDTMLAHINPREAEVLRRMGGQGSVNPNTGLKEYKGLKDALKIALPVALTFVAGPLGSAIGTSLTAGTALAGTIAAPILGGAAVGVGSAALQGALSGDLNFKDLALGAVSGGVGGATGPIGGMISNATGINPNTARFLAGAATGAGQAAIRGGNIGQGALSGVASQVFRNPIANTTKRASEVVLDGVMGMKTGLSNLTSGPMATDTGMAFTEMGDLSDVAGSFQSSSSPPMNEMFSNTFYSVADDGTLTNPQMNVETGLGPNADLMYGPVGAPAGINALDPVDPGFTLSDSAESGIDRLRAMSQSPKSPGNPFNQNQKTNPYLQMMPNALDDADFMGNQKGVVTGQPVSIFEKMKGALGNIGMQEVAGAALLASMLGDAGAAKVQGSISAMDDELKEYFNRNLRTWDWRKINAAANAKGTNINEFITNPKFIAEAESGMFDVNAPVPGSANPMMRARGGMSQINSFVSGAGSGRDDIINAKLSDGEFVVDAETVALLGDGSNKEGARRLNHMRENLRAHKGKTLSKGKFSPNAKAPLQYMKRSA